MRVFAVLLFVLFEFVVLLPDHAMVCSLCYRLGEDAVALYTMSSKTVWLDFWP